MRDKPVLPSDSYTRTYQNYHFWSIHIYTVYILIQFLYLSYSTKHPKSSARWPSPNAQRSFHPTVPLWCRACTRPRSIASAPRTACREDRRENTHGAGLSGAGASGALKPWKFQQSPTVTKNDTQKHANLAKNSTTVTCVVQFGDIFYIFYYLFPPSG